MQISLRVHAQSDQRLFLGGGVAVAWFEPHCEHRRCRSALGYLCSLMNAFWWGFYGLVCAYLVQQRCSSALGYLCSLISVIFLRFARAWFVLTVNTKGADQP